MSENQTTFIYFMPKYSILVQLKNYRDYIYHEDRWIIKKFLGTSQSNKQDVLSQKNKNLKNKIAKYCQKKEYMIQALQFGKQLQISQ